MVEFLISSRKLAIEIGVDPTTLRYWIRQGYIVSPSIPFGKRTYYSREEADTVKAKIDALKGTAAVDK